MGAGNSCPPCALRAFDRRWITWNRTAVSYLQTQPQSFKRTRYAPGRPRGPSSGAYGQGDDDGQMGWTHLHGSSAGGAAGGSGGGAERDERQGEGEPAVRPRLVT